MSKLIGTIVELRGPFVVVKEGTKERIFSYFSEEEAERAFEKIISWSNDQENMAAIELTDIMVNNGN